MRILFVSVNKNANRKDARETVKKNITVDNNWVIGWRNVRAQDTCMTNKILLNTGRNPLTDALLADGEQDPMWQVISVQNITLSSGQDLPIHPYVINGPNTWWLSTNSRYISFYNMFFGEPGARVEITRHFIVNSDDSFKLKTYFSVDDYVVYFMIDGVNYFTTEDTAASTNYSQQNLAINDTVIFLEAGCHDITCLYGNAEGVTNPTGMNIEGYIESKTGDSTLLREVCYEHNPPELIADNTLNYCHDCRPISPDLEINALNSCSNLNTAKVYFTSGYTPGQDTLQFAPQNGISAVFDVATGVLTLTGNANYSVWRQALQTVCYQSLVGNNSNNQKNIVISLGDALYNPDNGHYYKLINNGSNISWTDARDAAAATTYFGMQGYLVTVTSQEENDYLNSLIQSNTWMGASDATQEGVWRWVTGCEGLEDAGQGMHFSNQEKTGAGTAIPQSGINGNYANWYIDPTNPNNGEPNDAGCWPANHCEDYCHFIYNGLSQDGRWNDYPNLANLNAPVQNYIIEYGCMPGDPTEINIQANVMVNILPPSDTVITHTICEGDNYLGYSDAGVYSDTFISQSGCDSIRILNLTVINPAITPGSINICPGQAVTLQVDTVHPELCVISDLPANFQNGLIAYYPFCGTASDESGNEHNGIVDNAMLTTNRFGNMNAAYSFQPSDYSSITTNYLHTTDSNNFTFSVWVQPNQTQTIPPYDGADLFGGSFGILSQCVMHPVHGQCFGNEALDAGVGLYAGSNGLIVVEHSNNYVRAGLVNERALNGWHMITIVYQNKLPSLYIDGEFVKDGVAGTRNVFMSLAHDTNTYADYSQSGFGAGFYSGNNDTNQFFNGKIDDAFFWNRVLTANEISALYNLSDTGSYLWSNGVITNTTTLTPTQSTDYIVEVNYLGMSCYDTATIVVQIFDTLIEQTICEGATFEGYNTAGIYVDTFQTANGCDSIRTINLSVNPAFQVTINPTICAGENYEGYTLIGTYVDTFSNVNGCDSVRTIILTVNPVSDTTITQTICQGESFLGYTASGTFTDVFQNVLGCDSTRTLNLTVNPVSNTTITQIICQGENFLGYTTSGTYTDVFQNVSGCDSTRTIVLTVNPVSQVTINPTICAGENYEGYTLSGTYVDTFSNVNGCDSIRTIILTVNPVSDTTITQTICQGESFLGYTASGTYTDSFQNVLGCDSTRTLNLTVNPVSNTTITQIICQGENFLGYTTSGTYTDVFQNVLGCDSTRTIVLTVNPVSQVTINPTICAGENYEGYTFSGTYVDTFSNVNGCDSVRTIILTVNPVSDTTITQTICQGESFLGYTTSGTFTDVFQNVLGCDSTRTLNLTVNPVSDTTITQTICQGENFLAYTTSGTYTDVFQNVLGCDSARTIVLTVNPVSQVTINPTICAGENYEGYILSGTYVDTFSNVNGCDSIRTINLVVNPITNSNITDTICEGSYLFGYTSSGIYIDTLTNQFGCDSIRTLHLTVHPTTFDTVSPYICFGESYNGFTTSGSYQQLLSNANGCDSVLTINLTVSPPPVEIVMDTIGCESVIYHDNVYTSSITLHDTLHNTHGCDSIRHTTHIIVLPPPDTQTTSALACDSLLHNGQWYFNDTVLIDTTYNMLGCDSIYTVTDIRVIQLSISLTANRDSILASEALTLLTGGNHSYTVTGWYPQSWFADAHALSQIIHPPYSDSIIVMAVDDYGCTDTAMVWIAVAPVNEEMLLPSVFSPNGDGLNDVFRPVFGDDKGHVITTFQVFNRWGEQLYSGFGNNAGWDGRYKNAAVDVGVYQYYIIVQFADGYVKKIKGDVMVVR